MKYRDSGMPALDYWESLFDVRLVLERFGFDQNTRSVAELGCGYGTFTLPLAQRTGGVVHAFDIDSAMVATTLERARSAKLTGIVGSVRDVAATGFGLDSASCDACLLFNILHGESPVPMLREAARVVRPGGVVAVIHWRSDIPTPRGPDLSIRPRPEHVAAWAREAGSFESELPAFLLPPWHFGLRLVRTPDHPSDR